MTQRWNIASSAYRETPEIDLFLDEIIAVCQKHGLSIGHEDGHGAFQIQKADEMYFDWLRKALDNR